MTVADHTIPTLGPRLEKALWVLGIALILAFLYLPIVILVAYSFNDSRSLSWPMSGVTLDWYRTLAANEQLIKAIGNSLYVAGCSTLLTLIIGVPAALALDRVNFPGKGLFRKLILLPIALPGIITGISMLTLFRMFGMNLSLETVIIGHATALLAVVVTQVYARLQRLPKSYEEASSDLGAGILRTFFLITLPLLSPVLLFNLVTTVIAAFQQLTLALLLTGGGPIKSTYMLAMYIYDTAFKYQDMGYAAAMSWLMLLLIIALTLVIFKFSSMWVFYETEVNRDKS